MAQKYLFLGPFAIQIVSTLFISPRDFCECHMKWIVETKENVYANGQERERKKTDLLDKLIIRVSSRDVPDLHLSIHTTRSLDLV